MQSNCSVTVAPENWSAHGLWEEKDSYESKENGSLIYRTMLSGSCRNEQCSCTWKDLTLLIPNKEGCCLVVALINWHWYNLCKEEITFIFLPAFIFSIREDSVNNMDYQKEKFKNFYINVHMGNVHWLMSQRIIKVCVIQYQINDSEVVMDRPRWRTEGLEASKCRSTNM